MNKKATIIILAIALTGFIIYKWVSSYQTLYINYDKSVNGVTTKVSSDGEEVASVSDTVSIRLKKGAYRIETSGSEDFAATGFNVNLGNAKEEIIINPDFSEKKLSELLTREIGSIKSTVARDINLGNKYKINNGKLYAKGDWYGTTIVPNLSDEELRMDYVDIFRVILKKEGNNWVLVTKKPELVLSTLNFSQIPANVINDTNRQFGNELTN